jgi:hypothetical protein
MTRHSFPPNRWQDFAALRIAIAAFCALSDTVKLVTLFDISASRRPVLTAA